MPPAAPAGDGTPPRLRTILVIEDQPEMRRNLTTILGMEGYHAISAVDGAQGLRLAREELPDLVLCDIMLPGLDGYGVLQALRADCITAGLPFIFLTAKGDKADFRTGMNLGADDYLAKPVSRLDLIHAITVRFERERQSEAAIRARLMEANPVPDFSSPGTLVKALGLTTREAEVLLWVAQGKSNADVAVILGMSDKTVKKHLGHIFEKLGVESRTSASLRAIEALPRRDAAPAPLPRSVPIPFRPLTPPAAARVSGPRPLA